MNLFTCTRAMTQLQEDHLTAFLAAAIELSPAVRAGYFEAVLGDFTRARAIEGLKITSVDIQCSYPEKRCRPDMLLMLSNGMRVVCEHKLEAAETLGPESDERGQLLRYLDLDIDALVYFRASIKDVPAEVLANPKYVRPAGLNHFLWRDIYPILQSPDDLFIQWLREGFEQLGFVPPYRTNIAAIHEVLQKMDESEYFSRTYVLEDLGKEFTFTVDPTRLDYPCDLKSPGVKFVMFNPAIHPTTNEMLARFFTALGVVPPPQI